MHPFGPAGLLSGRSLVYGLDSQGQYPEWASHSNPTSCCPGWSLHAQIPPCATQIPYHTVWILPCATWIGPCAPGSCLVVPRSGLMSYLGLVQCTCTLILLSKSSLTYPDSASRCPDFTSCCPDQALCALSHPKHPDWLLCAPGLCPYLVFRAILSDKQRSPGAGGRQ